jgi:uncharacterized protein
MQKVKLPKQLDPIKNAVKGATYSGVYLCNDLPRFSDSVSGHDEAVDVDVKFDIDNQGLAFFTGKMSVSVSLICQRCQQMFSMDIEVNFCFSPIQDDEEIYQPIPESHEPVELDEQGQINLLEILEDELILALPIVALHPVDQCAVASEWQSFGEIDEVQRQPSPFAVLKTLNKK